MSLRNELTQRAIARECAEWMRQKAIFRSNRSRAPIQQFAAVSTDGNDSIYLPLHGFTAVDLGYAKGDAVSNFVNRMDEQPTTGTYLSLFDQILNNPAKLEDVTAKLCEHTASVYRENSPERIDFLMLYNIFSEFLEDISADGIIKKPETYNGCILADSVGLGQTFTALSLPRTASATTCFAIPTCCGIREHPSVACC